MSSRDMAAGIAVAVLAAGCASQRQAVQRHDVYAELVSLRGSAVTMLQHHDISPAEATMIQHFLNEARQDADSGHNAAAQEALDQVSAYLKARQPGAL